MKKRKLPSILAISISLEFILSPLPVIAQDKPSAGSKILEAINLGSTVYGNLRGQGQPQVPQHVALDMAEFQKQQTPLPDKHFTLQNLSKIPGLMEYMAKKNMDAAASGGKQINPNSLNCSTLPATLFEAKNEVCRMEKVSMINGINPQLQAQEAFAYFNQYEQINKTYRNFSSKSNVSGQNFGVGCMEDAMDVLKGFFAYRLEQMDTMVAEMEAATAKFKDQSEMDLKAIRESTAILNGEGSKFATEFKGTDIFDYGKRFNNPACNSIFSNNEMDKMGKETGLVSIEKRLKDSYSSKAPGSKYSPESYIKNHADVMEDIKSMADKVSVQANLNFSSIANSPTEYGKFLDSVGSSISSESGAHNGLNRAFFSDLQTKFGQSRKKLTDQMNVLSSELGPRANSALSLLSDADNDSSFEAEVTSIENSIKNECINRSGIDSALGRIYDPNLSKEANKQAAQHIRKRIKAIISDPKLSPEKKMEELKLIEGSGGSRYELKLDSDYETQVVDSSGKLVKKKISASSRVTPGGFFSDVIRNCESQFQVNKLNNKLSAKEAVKQLRTLKKDYQKLARQHSKDIKDEIVKKMIDCNGNASTQNSLVEASCSPESLNMQSPGFCAKGAFSCSKNMQQCTEQAKNFVKEIKNDRLKRTTNYNNNVEANRKQLVAMFDQTLVKYMKEAENLRAMFGAGFAPPKDIKRDIKDGSQFDPAFLGEKGDPLELKDPEKYLEMIKANMESLRAQVDEQQKAIMGDDGTLAKHMRSTKENYDKIISGPNSSSDLAQKCDRAYRSYDQMVAQQKSESDKLRGELGEKRTDFCSRYSDIMEVNPIAGCDDGYADVTDSLIKAAEKAGDFGTAQQARQMRKEMADVCKQPGNQRNSDGDFTITAFDVCAKAENLDLKAQNAITKLIKGQDSWKTVCEALSDGDLAKKYCNEKTSTTSVGKETYYDCTSLEKRIVANYTQGRNDQSLLASTPSFPDSTSFCNASNNAGRQTTEKSLSEILDEATKRGGGRGTAN